MESTHIKMNIQGCKISTRNKLKYIVVSRTDDLIAARDPAHPPPAKTSGKLEFEYFGDRVSSRVQTESAPVGI